METEHFIIEAEHFKIETENVEIETEHFKMKTAHLKIEALRLNLNAQSARSSRGSCETGKQATRGRSCTSSGEHKLAAENREEQQQNRKGTCPPKDPLRTRQPGQASLVGQSNQMPRMLSNCHAAMAGHANVTRPVLLRVCSRSATRLSHLNRMRLHMGRSNLRLMLRQQIAWCDHSSAEATTSSPLLSK